MSSLRKEGRRTQGNVQQSYFFDRSLNNLTIGLYCRARAANELINAGIPVTVILDSAVGFIMEKVCDAL